MASNMNFAFSFILGRQVALSQGASAQQATSDGFFSAIVRQPLGLLMALFLARNQSGGQAGSASTSKTRTKTTTTLVDAPAVGAAGVTLTATIGTTPKRPPATGTVSFNAKSRVLGVLPVHKDKAVLVLTADLLAKGDHRVTATYSGDANHSGSTSDEVTVKIP